MQPMMVILPFPNRTGIHWTINTNLGTLDVELTCWTADEWAVLPARLRPEHSSIFGNGCHVAMKARPVPADDAALAKGAKESFHYDSRHVADSREKHREG